MFTDLFLDIHQLRGSRASQAYSYASSTPTPKSNIRVVPGRKMIDPCADLKIHQFIIPLILMIGVVAAAIAIPIGCYFLHCFSLTETILWVVAVPTVLVIALFFGNRATMLKKEKQLKNIFKEVLNGTRKICTLKLSSALECLQTLRFEEKEFSALQPTIAKNYTLTTTHLEDTKTRFERIETGKPPEEMSSVSHLGADHPEPPTGRIGYINGILTDYPLAYQNALQVSLLSGGHNVHIAHNATHGAVDDLLECKKGLFDRVATEPVACLHTMWDEFFNTDNQGDFLQICHSQGAIHVLNALESYPDEERRQRIRVVAIAPATYIPNGLCKKASHYITGFDPVPYIDSERQERASDVTYIEPFNYHPDNHYFTNEIYLHPIQDEIKKFISP